MNEMTRTKALYLGAPERTHKECEPQHAWILAGHKDQSFPQRMAFVRENSAVQEKLRAEDDEIGFIFGWHLWYSDAKKRYNFLYED